MDNSLIMSEKNCKTLNPKSLNELKVFLRNWSNKWIRILNSIKNTAFIKIYKKI